MTIGARALVVGVLVLVSACSQSPTAPTTPIGGEFELGAGETAVVTGASIGVRFDGVRGDVRCPPGFFCVLGGSAIVDISVLADEGTSRFELHTGSLEPIHYRDLTIALVKLTPFPFSSRESSPGEYRATLRVTR